MFGLDALGSVVRAGTVVRRFGFADREIGVDHPVLLRSFGGTRKWRVQWRLARRLLPA